MKKLIVLLTVIVLTACTGVIVYDDYTYNRPVYHQNYRVVRETRLCPVCHGTGKLRTSIGPRYDRYYRFRYCNVCRGTGRIYTNRVYRRYLY